MPFAARGRTGLHGVSLIGHARQRHRAAPKGSNCDWTVGSHTDQSEKRIRDGAGPVGASKKFAARSGSCSSRTVAKRKRSGKVRPGDSAKLRTHIRSATRRGGCFTFTVTTTELDLGETAKLAAAPETRGNLLEKEGY